MKTDEKLKQEVVFLNDRIFSWKIEPTEKHVSRAVMSNIIGLFMGCLGSPFEGACAAEKAVNKIKDENQRLLICKQLLTGEVVKIPGLHGDYRLWSVFYNMHTGEKINEELLMKAKVQLSNHLFIPKA
jgi:hypothetical protein